jgi:feruloyl esterase
MRMTREWLVWGAAALVVVGAMVSTSVDAAQNCADLVRPGLFPNTVVQTAVAIPADATTGTPAFCEVTAQISPVAGSRITAVYRLPDNWNGRMLGLGGAGFAGILNLRAPAALTGPSRAADAGLPRGYATAQTDGGHPSPDPLDTSWMRNNPVAQTDFSHRAVHEMTVLGKGVVASYYGRPATKSYFQGCSTGGRMGLMEAQRYPDDYDGVVVGAPVHSLLTQSSTVVRDQIFKAPGATLPVEQIKLVYEAVLSACDETDGLKDGVITDPRRCEWKPESLACKAGEAGGSCLTPPQVEALNAVYRTVATPSGVVGNYGLTRGSEMGWNPALVPTTPGGRAPF